MLDFSATPEISPVECNAGPGSGSMMAAAAAWDSLAAELAISRRRLPVGYLERPARGWAGACAASMVAYHAFMAWLSATAGSAEQAGHGQSAGSL